MGVQYVQDRQSKYILGHNINTLLIQGKRIITYTDITVYAINGACQYKITVGNSELLESKIRKRMFWQLQSAKHNNQKKY